MAATEAPVATPQESQAPTIADDKPGLQVGHGAILRAIEKNLQENSVSVRIAGLGTVRLPALESLAWMGGVVALAAFDVLEWPVAVAIGAGHLLAHQQHLRLLHDFGEALENA